MHYLLLPMGSAGDVLPFCALGRRLAARGHSVTVAANPHFAELVARAGLALEPLGDASDFTAEQRAMHPIAGLVQLLRWADSLANPTYEVVAAHRRSTVIAHPLAFGARLAEARHGVRTATLLLSPAILYSAHAPPKVPYLPNGESLPDWYKRSVRRALDRLILDRLALRGADHPFVALFPEWFAPRQPDWPRELSFTGFPLDEDPAPLPPEIEQFLDEGEPPVVITPGTNNRHAQAFFAAALEAAARLGRRALLLTRYPAQLPHLPPHARHFAWAPLGPLLRRAAALVHHGGIGTAATALAAGVPQAVIPFSYDQPDNAARLERLGVGAWLRRPSARRLAAELARLLLDPSVKSACKQAAARVTAARPLDDAADLLETRGMENVA
jgi:UDP:flavonoid glycosyltransferase YjiC (YdhE family)